MSSLERLNGNNINQLNALQNNNNVEGKQKTSDNESGFIKGLGGNGNSAKNIVDVEDEFLEAFEQYKSGSKSTLSDEQKDDLQKNPAHTRNLSHEQRIEAYNLEADRAGISGEQREAYIQMRFKSNRLDDKIKQGNIDRENGSDKNKQMNSLAKDVANGERIFFKRDENGKLGLNPKAANLSGKELSEVLTRSEKVTKGIDISKYEKAEEKPKTDTNENTGTNTSVNTNTNANTTEETTNDDVEQAKKEAEEAIEKADKKETELRAKKMMQKLVNNESNTTSSDKAKAKAKAEADKKAAEARLAKAQKELDELNGKNTKSVSKTNPAELKQQLSSFEKAIEGNKQALSNIENQLALLNGSKPDFSDKFLYNQWKADKKQLEMQKKEIESDLSANQKRYRELMVQNGMPIKSGGTVSSSSSSNQNIDYSKYNKKNPLTDFTNKVKEYNKAGKAVNSLMDTFYQLTHNGKHRSYRY